MSVPHRRGSGKRPPGPQTPAEAEALDPAQSTQAADAEAADSASDCESGTALTLMGAAPAPAAAKKRRLTKAEQGAHRRFVATASRLRSALRDADAVAEMVSVALSHAPRVTAFSAEEFGKLCMAWDSAVARAGSGTAAAACDAAARGAEKALDDLCCAADVGREQLEAIAAQCDIAAAGEAHSGQLGAVLDDLAGHADALLAGALQAGPPFPFVAVDCAAVSIMETLSAWLGTLEEVAAGVVSVAGPGAATFLRGKSAPALTHNLLHITAPGRPDLLPFLTLRFQQEESVQPVDVVIVPIALPSGVEGWQAAFTVSSNSQKPVTVRGMVCGVELPRPLALLQRGFVGDGHFVAALEIRGGSANCHAMTISPGGDWLALANTGEPTVSVFALPSGRHMHTFAPGKGEPGAAPPFPHSICATAAGTLLVTECTQPCNGRVVEVTIEGTHIRDYIPHLADPPVSVAASSRAGQVAVLTNRTLTVGHIGPSTHTLIVYDAPPTRPISGPDSPSTAVESESLQASAPSVGEGPPAVQWVVEAANKGVGLAYSDTGSVLACADAAGVSVYACTGELVRRVRNDWSGSRVGGVALTATGRAVFFSFMGQTFVVEEEGGPGRNFSMHPSQSVPGNIIGAMCVHGSRLYAYSHGCYMVHLFK